MPLLRFLLIAALTLAVSACREQPDTRAATASLILVGGNILTLADQGQKRTAAAVAVRDGRILYAGEDSGALQFRDAGTEVIELQGATLIPGFIDSHCHLYGLGTALAQIDLVGTASAAAAVAVVAGAAREVPGQGWLLGRGWDQNDWPTKAYPDRTLLDAVTGARPAIFRRIDGHAAWANSAALQMAGIGPDTPDPQGGSILRDDRGRPTGILIDNAVDLVKEVIPKADRAEKRRRIGLAIAHCLSFGLTGVHEAGLDFEILDIYRQMAAAGELPLRIYGMFDDKPEILARAQAEGPYFGPEGMLTVRAVKLYADGALGSRGALLLADYSDQPGTRGLAVTPVQHLTEVARDLGGMGFQICTHAIGDGGNRLVLDVYAEVLADLGQPDPRWRIEHAQILAAADIPRFARLGVIAAMQPTHCTSDMDWADRRLGQDRLEGAYAWRSLLDQGAHVCFGTDFPIEAVDPLWGLYAARTRTHHDGTPTGGWMLGQRLDALTALQLYTSACAYAAFQEGELGRIAPGFRADFTVLEDDPVACDPPRLLTIKTLMTIVDGKVVFRREP